jgi:hypothetical protein
MMAAKDEPPLSASTDDPEKVRAVLDAVSALTPEEVVNLAGTPPDLSFSGIETSPDTVFFNPARDHFEAAATVYVTFGSGGRHATTESFSAVVKGSVNGGKVVVDDVNVDTPELYEDTPEFYEAG